MKPRALLLSFSFLAIVACHRPAPAPVGLPLSVLPTAPLATLVWVGRGEAERYDHGHWVRVPELDYEFSVEQRRFADHWDSVKTLRRIHPAYDGVAGPRVQFMTFHIGIAADGDRARYALESSLGDGGGSGDRAFRAATLEIAIERSWLAGLVAPFDRYRITQRYGYETGTLDEVVELLDGEAPFLRNTEHARLYGPRQYDAGSPTVLNTH